MKRLFSLEGLVILGLFIFSACFNFEGRGVDGNGNVKEEDRAVEAFTRIKVGQSIDANITIDPNASPSLTLQADENLLALIVTEVRNDELIISLKENVNQRKALTANIIVSELAAIDASSSANAVVKTPFTADEFSCDASSGADIKLATVTANYFSGTASSGADLVIQELTTQTLKLATSSNSDIELQKGSATNSTLTASSSGDIDASNFATQTCNAIASSGADIATQVTTQLTATASSGGLVKYSGSLDAANVNASTSSGGRVRAAN